MNLNVTKVKFQKRGKASYVNYGNILIVTNIIKEISLLIYYIFPWRTNLRVYNTCNSAAYAVSKITERGDA